MPTKRKPRRSETMTEREMTDGLVDYVVASVYRAWEDIQVNPKKRHKHDALMSQCMENMTPEQLVGMLMNVDKLHKTRTNVNVENMNVLDVRSDRGALSKIQVPVIEYEANDAEKELQDGYDPTAD